MHGVYGDPAQVTVRNAAWFGQVVIPRSDPPFGDHAEHDHVELTGVTVVWHAPSRIHRKAGVISSPV
jgi:hypothetical protein